MELFDSGCHDGGNEIDIGHVHRRIHLDGSSGDEVLSHDRECSHQIKKLKKKKKKRRRRRRSMSQKKRKMASPR